MLPRRTVSAPVADSAPAPPWQHANTTLNHQLLFKKHKVLPHPRKDASYAALRAASRLPALAATSATGSFSDDLSTNTTDTPAASRHYPKQPGTGPDLPPTPPAHSRNSSATYSALPPSATDVQTLGRSAEDVPMKPPLTTTPTKQMSPPTPDVTPPQPAQRESRQASLASQPHLPVRHLSKGTTDSRTESFRTARETPWSSSSDEEECRSALRPAPASARTSETAARHIPLGASNGPDKARQLKTVGLGLGLESSPDESPALKSGGPEFAAFDGVWGSGAENDSLDRNAVVRTRPLLVSQNEVIDDVAVSPSNATKAVRSMSLPQRILTFPSPDERPGQSRISKQQQQQRHQSQSQNPHPPLASSAPIVSRTASSSESSTSDSGRRVSTMSSKSTVSTVVETFFVDSPPQRRRTLRHVKKHIALRDSGQDASPASSTPSSVVLSEVGNQRRPNPTRTNGSGHDSMFSTATFSSTSSRGGRREVWKAGGIPVVVIPGRMSSVKSVASREPSLRSTSSRRSKRSASLHSAPLSQFSKSRDISPSPEQRGRRNRTYSESDGSAPGDQRTIDYPPTIPKRSSSLSAPTSRNVSRAGSMTTESVKAHSAFLIRQPKDQKPMQVPLATAETPPERAPELPAELAPAPALKPLEPAVDQKPSGAQAVLPSLTTARSYDEESPDDVLFPEVRINQALLHEPTILRRAGEFSPGIDKELDFDHDRRHLDTAWNFDHTAERISSKHLSPHNTPFSMVSVETATTHHSEAEVSEALAMNIYPHQNTSVLMVDHSNRPSDCSDGSQRDRLTDPSDSSSSKQETSPASEFASTFEPTYSSIPTWKTAVFVPDDAAGDGTPLTPPHQVMSMEDVDSPLRNPRSPPAPPDPTGPPAINFIPATPSGLTPSIETEQTRGDVFVYDDVQLPPRRSVSEVLHRALSRGRSTTRYGPSASRTGGLLTRTLSLTRRGAKRASSLRRADSMDRGKGFFLESEPVEEDKLHPFWRPASSHYPDGHDYTRYENDAKDEDETYRYPPIDNRPWVPQRSLSARMKRTFAILPLDDDDYFYPATDRDGPERRTVRRTPSGNLRVVKYRRSLESLGRRVAPEQEGLRPSTALGGNDSGQRSHFWRSLSVKFSKGREPVPLAANLVASVDVADTAEAAKGRHEEKRTDNAASILPMIGDKIGEYGHFSGPHTLVRRFSERRRERRSNELRQKISGPQIVRDGVGDVIRRTTYRDAFTQAQVG